MLFTEPKSFKAGLEFMQQKELLPTDMSSAELMAAYSPDIRARSMLSARVNNADFLQETSDLITRIVSPDEIKDPETGEMRPVKPGEYMNPATARLALQQAVQRMGYQPDPEKRGGLQDLSSDVRLNLIIKTNTEMAQGYGFYTKSQDPAALEAFPAQELYRLESREKPRDWANRWLNAGGKIYDGRMIALKNDPVWENLSVFGLPYPPFDFNSGMWVMDVSYGEAIDMGLIAENDPVPEPDTRSINDDLEVPINDVAGDLQKSLLDSLKGTAEMVDGMLKLLS